METGQLLGLIRFLWIIKFPLDYHILIGNGFLCDWKWFFID